MPRPPLAGLAVAAALYAPRPRLVLFRDADATAPAPYADANVPRAAGLARPGTAHGAQ